MRAPPLLFLPFLLLPACFGDLTDLPEIAITTTSIDDHGEIDLDIDDDGVPNAADNCPWTHNPDQENFGAYPNDLGDDCDPNHDDDTLDNEDDNCPFTSNNSQRDLDGDGEGDACDDDIDDDGILNDWDICYDDAANFCVPAKEFDCHREGQDAYANSFDACVVDLPDRDFKESHASKERRACHGAAIELFNVAYSACADEYIDDPNDLDGDRVPDGDDNCPGFFNPSPIDFDFNGVGDRCQDYSCEIDVNSGRCVQFESRCKQEHSHEKSVMAAECKYFTPSNISSGYLFEKHGLEIPTSEIECYQTLGAFVLNGACED